MFSEKNIIPSSLEPGKIKFHDNYLPKIPAGVFEIKVETEIETNPLIDSTIQFSQSQKFIVEGNQFKLGVDDIHAVFPPANASGIFHKTLPQIVFRKRNLPWERNPFGNNTIPWLALIVLEEDELIFDASEKKKPTPTNAYVRTVQEVIYPGTGFVQPEFNNSSITGDESLCYAIDISSDTFTQIVPAIEELPYLAHVREINTEDKELLGMHADGWFSIISANRFPKPHETVEGQIIPSRNIVHLVSLDGFKEQMQVGNNGSDKFRLVSLASWQFFSAAPKEGFKKLMNGLSNGALQLPMNLNRTPHLNKATINLLENITQGGYTPLQYNTRVGEKTMAWYRGPLTPVLTKDINLEPAFSVESNMIYDPGIGLFDLSFSTAWQIGRLIALSDAHFSVNLLRWKQNILQELNNIAKRQTLQKNLKILNFPEDLEGMMDRQLPAKLLTEWLQTGLLPLAEKIALRGQNAPRKARSNSKESNGLSKKQVEALMKDGYNTTMRLVDEINQRST